MTGNIKGAGKEGEHFEMSIPENVMALLDYLTATHSLILELHHKRRCENSKELSLRA
jgi:hypothetical protein